MAGVAAVMSRGTAGRAYAETAGKSDRFLIQSWRQTVSTSGQIRFLCPDITNLSACAAVVTSLASVTMYDGTKLFQMLANRILNPEFCVLKIIKSVWFEQT